jgi:hypothetical protein
MSAVADLREAADLIREAMEDYGSSYGRKARHALARAEARVYRALEELEEPRRLGMRAPVRGDAT